jgi:hypothetical protein
MCAELMKPLKGQNQNRQETWGGFQKQKHPCKENVYSI